MLVVFSVYDRVSGMYGNLNTSPNVDSAKRNIKLSFMRDPMLEASKDDYSLAILAEFDERSGELIPLTKPDFIPVSSILYGTTEGEVKDV